MTTGVLQGDTLAPFLFVIVIDYIMRQVPSTYGFATHQESGIVLHDLDYADDMLSWMRQTTLHEAIA